MQLNILGHRTDLKLRKFYPCTLQSLALLVNSIYINIIILKETINNKRYDTYTCKNPLNLKEWLYISLIEQYFPLFTIRSLCQCTETLSNVCWKRNIIVVHILHTLLLGAHILGHPLQVCHEEQDEGPALLHPHFSQVLFPTELHPFQDASTRTLECPVPSRQAWSAVLDLQHSGINDIIKCLWVMRLYAYAALQKISAF